MKTPIILFVAFIPLWAQDGAPVIRANFAPSGPVLVGQPVRLTISVLVPTFFSDAPGFPALEIPGAVTAPTEDQPRHLSETINGTAYFGIAKDYLIYPQSPGEFMLPSETIPVKYSIGGIKTAQSHLKLPAAKFTAIIPPEAEGLGYFIATTNLTVSQHIDKKLTNLKAGDSFHRTIIVHAASTFSMFLPPLSFDAPEGIRVYLDQPKVDDLRTDRGDFTGGRRIDSATYVIQKEGHYQLPEILISWWDLNAKHMRTARIRAIDFDATPNPEYKPDLTPYIQPEIPAQPIEGSRWDQAKRWVRPMAIIFAVAFVFWLIWRRYAPKVRAHIARGKWEKEHSAAAQLERVRVAAKRNDAPAAMRELLRLGDRLRNDSWVIPSRPELRKSIDDLEKCLYSSEPAVLWVGKPLADALAAARQGNRAAVHQRKSNDVLPPLNP